jgi:hypothetical protein
MGCGSRLAQCGSEKTASISCQRREGAVGQNVYDQIQVSTKMIYRDMVGWWRIKDEYKDFLKRGPKITMLGERAILDLVDHEIF